MNKNNQIKPSCIHITTLSIATIICIYIVIVTLKSMSNEAAIKNADKLHSKPINSEKVINHIFKISDKEAIKSKDIKTVVDTGKDITNNGYDESVVSRSNVETTIKAAPEIRKTIILLDANREMILEVCFAAKNESVFMSYGWKGLVEKAMYHKDVDLDLNNIKVELKSNCSPILVAKYKTISLNKKPNPILVSTSVL